MSLYSSRPHAYFPIHNMSKQEEQMYARYGYEKCLRFERFFKSHEWMEQHRYCLVHFIEEVAHIEKLSLEQLSYDLDLLNEQYLYYPYSDDLPLIVLEWLLRILASGSKALIGRLFRALQLHINSRGIHNSNVTLHILNTLALYHPITILTPQFSTFCLIKSWFYSNLLIETPEDICYKGCKYRKDIYTNIDDLIVIIDTEDPETRIRYKYIQDRYSTAVKIPSGGYTLFMRKQKLRKITRADLK